MYAAHSARRDHLIRTARRARQALQVEALEQRTMLSSAATVTPAASSLSSGITAQNNQAYIDALAGTSQLDSAQQSALKRRLTAELNNGTPREKVVLDLLTSRLSRDVQVQSTYVALLGRSPTVKELNAGVSLVQKAGDTRALVVALAGSPEYYKLRGQGTATGFVNAIYQTILQRAPSSPELSAALKALGRHVSRGELARRLMSSKEALTVLINGAEAQLGAQAPGPQSHDYQILSQRGGLVRLMARTLASDVIFQQAVHPATSPTTLPSSSDDYPPGYPIAPGFDLASGVQPLGMSTDFLYQVTAVSAGSDDVPWIGTNLSLYTYNVNSGTTTFVNGYGRFDSIAAIDANEAYAVAQHELNQNPAVLHLVNGTATTLPALPGGDIASQVAASADGLVWVLSQSGNLYSFASTSQSWSPVSTDGYTLASITIGSASNIWALTTSGVGLQYSSGTGFQPDSFLTSSVSAIQATSDGAVWAVVQVQTDSFVYMKPSWGVWELTPVQPTGLFSNYFAAGSMNRSFDFGTVYNSTNKTFTPQADLVSVGVADRQAIPYPAFTGAEEQAYQALSAAVTTLPGGLRSLYDTPGLDWGTIQNELIDAIPFANIPAAAWGAVKQELLTETGDVSQVYGRLELIQNLYSQVQAINDGQLTAAATAENLIVNNQPSDTTIRVVLEDIFEAIASAVSSTGIPPAGAVVASMLASGFSDGISYYESLHNDPPGQAVSIAFYNLQTALDSIFQQGIDRINTDISKIVGDYGKVQAVAEAILNAQWPWLNSTSTQFINTVTHEFAVQFYQTLTAAGWQVVYFQYTDYVNYPVTQILKVNPYDIYQVPLGYQDGMPTEEVYFMNQLGSSHDVNGSYLGPFPSQTLIDAIASLGTSENNDFWTGQNGWGVIQHVQGTGS